MINLSFDKLELTTISLLMYLEIIPVANKLSGAIYSIYLFNFLQHSCLKHRVFQLILDFSAILFLHLPQRMRRNCKPKIQATETLILISVGLQFHIFILWISQTSVTLQMLSLTHILSPEELSPKEVGSYYYCTQAFISVKTNIDI